MNVQQLPNVLIDKIHDDAYDCTSVGLTNAPCLPNQITVNAWNDLVGPPAQNVAKCCRNAGQFQSFFNARATGYERLAQRILTSVRPDEATPGAIRTLLTTNLQPGHFDLVKRLLSHVHHMRFAFADFQGAIPRPIVFKKILEFNDDGMNINGMSINDAFDILEAAIVNEKTYLPHESIQLWKRYTGTLKESSSYVCSTSFADSLSKIVEDQYVFLKSDSTIPQVPGIVVQVGDMLYEHCCFPCISLLLSKLVNHTFTSAQKSTYVYPAFEFFLEFTPTPLLDLTILELFWSISSRSEQDSVSLVSNKYLQILTRTLAHHHMSSVATTFIEEQCKESNIRITYNGIMNVLANQSFTTDGKMFAITRLLTFENLPTLTTSDILSISKICILKNLISSGKQILRKCPFVSMFNDRYINQIRANQNRARYINQILIEVLSSVFSSDDIIENLIENTFENALGLVLVIFEKVGINTESGIRITNVSLRALDLGLVFFYLTPENKNRLKNKVKDVLGILVTFS
tara:strand:- start:255 stop:1808 length:1554 start_codon:yes stop_codon:yes gene_type:complete